MSWQDVRGHDRQYEWFKQQYASGRLGSSFLFIGPPGIGKRTFAIKLAQALLCEKSPQVSLTPCQECSACRQVKAGTHPDLHSVAREQTNSRVSIEQMVGRTEHRGREGLCYDISLKSYCGGKRVAIIDDADDLTGEAAAALLKTLEEPPADSVIILIGTNRQRQLPTIRSRCQIVRFSPLSRTELTGLIVELGLCEDPHEAEQLARLGNGSVERAKSFIGSGVLEFREEFFFKLASPATVLTELLPLVNQCVDEAAEDVPADQKVKAKRRRMRVVIEMTTQFFRLLVRQLVDAPLEEDEKLAKAVSLAARHWPGDVETALACLDCCLEADVYVQQNANQKTLVEAWLDQLQSLIRTQDSITLPVS